MRKKILIKVNRIVFLLMLILFFLATPMYSYYKSFYPARNEESKIIVVTGDSYAGYFAGYECLKDYSYLIYADAGKSTKENFSMMKEAVNTYPEIVIISLGVNDHNKLESPRDFGNRIEELILICKEQRKKVILHTYMNYDTGAFNGLKRTYAVSDYDDELKKLGERYSNTFYIDMSDYNNELFWQEDRIHYNKIFYDELYNRILTTLILSK